MSSSQPVLADLCFPVVPVWVWHGVGLCGAAGGRAGLLGRLLGLWGARVQHGRRFVGVEGPTVVFGPRGACWSVIRHPPEVLQRTVSSALVVVGAEVIRTPSFGVRMPVIVGSVAPVVPVVSVVPVIPVVPVVVVLVVVPFPRGVIVAVAA